MWQPGEVLFPDVASEMVLRLRPMLAPDIKVAIDLTGWRRTQPSVQIARVGGKSVGLYDDALIQIDVRSPVYDDCTDLMNLVRAKTRTMPLIVDWVKSVRESSGVRWVPEPDDALPRMVTDFVVRCVGTQTQA